MAKIMTDAQAQAITAKGEDASGVELKALEVYENETAGADEAAQAARAEAEAATVAEAEAKLKADAEATGAADAAEAAKKTIGQRTTPANDMLVRLASEGYVDNMKLDENNNLVASSDWKDLTVSFMPANPDGDKEPRVIYLSELINVTENGLKRVTENLDGATEAKKQLAKIKKTGLSKAELLALIAGMED